MPSLLSADEVRSELIQLLLEYCKSHYRTALDDSWLTFERNKVRQQYFVHLVFRLRDLNALGDKTAKELYDICMERYNTALTFDEYEFLWLLNAFTEYVQKLTGGEIAAKFNERAATDISQARDFYRIALSKGNLYLDLLLAIVYIFAEDYKTKSFSDYINSDAMAAVMAADIEDVSANIFTMNREVTTDSFTDNSYIGYNTPFLYDVAQYKSTYLTMCTLIQTS